MPWNEKVNTTPRPEPQKLNYFTGRKDSIEGTLSVNDALRSFSIRTVVANKQILNDIVDGQESSFLSTRFIL